ncbi:MAG: M12 family metallo-peptidase [Weeksellaceae bacterium]
MVKHLLVALILLCSTFVCSQELIRPSEVIEKLSQKRSPEKITLFKTVSKDYKQLSETLDEYVVVDFNQKEIKILEDLSKDFIEMEVPVSNHESVTLQLVKINLFDDNNYVKTFPSEKTVDVQIGAHYRGIVKGKPETLVALSIFDDEIMGLAAGLYGSNLVIGKIEGQDEHVVYLDNQIAKHQNFECGVKDDQISYDEHELTYSAEEQETALADKCIRFYIEVNYDLYRNKGSEAATSNFVTGFMNQVMTLYANENINTKLMPIAIWTQPSPYTASGTYDLMRQFQNYRTNWEGDLAQLVGFSGGGGIAAGFSGVCNYDRRQSMSYSGINSSYNTVPTYSWTVNVVTHEYGHIMGSRHTHACVWNGNGTAIDGCAGFVEGNCYQPGYPSGGGTIMSYCHQTSVGMNLAKGFGTQPGNVIRNRVANGSCLGSCTTNPDPDPDPSDCDYNEVNVKIKTDNYPRETTWVIYDSDGNRFATGYNYTAANTVYDESVCLPDGCYIFEMLDSEGDGICCDYGNGSYSVTFNGQTLASGGRFQNSDKTDLCVGTVDPEPTCINTSVVFKTDKYPAETSWNLKNSNNEVVASGSNISSRNNLITVEECIDPGCYVLTFNDSYGDGFCCSYGNGYLQFYEGSQIILNQWANFGRSVSYQVCVGTGTSESVQEIILRSEIPPFTTDFNIVSPFTESLDIKFAPVKEDLIIKDLKVMDMNGREIYRQHNVSTNNAISVDASSWASGVYVVTFISDNQQESVKVIKK